MSMNAVLAAKTVDFGSSLALDPSLRSGIKAADVYRMGAELAFGKEVGSATVDRIVARLGEKGSAIKLKEALASDRLRHVRLDSRHKKALERVTRLTKDKNLSAQDAIEKAFVEDGNGVPAIAILILLVVVIVAVLAQQ
ncbi:MAG: hypothetical protein Tsb008_08050 [Rhodothalassiaceae bacterium]